MTYNTHSKNSTEPSNPVKQKETGFKVRLWDGNAFDEARTIHTDSPTGRTILQTFELLPADEY